MTLSNYFETFCEEITVDDDESKKWTGRIKEITKKLNKKYYDSESNKDNIFIVGSVGRGTAIHNVSDYDCIFEMPSEKFKQFDNYSGNGQSSLLQEVKKEVVPPKEEYKEIKIDNLKLPGLDEEKPIDIDGKDYLK